MNNKPIGIFDSGIGGLTVAKAIKEALPNERIIYFGDTAHLPYGDKSKESIRAYSKRITGFLLSKGCKAIVIACNTASAHAYSELRKFYPKVPIINVVNPTVNYCAEKFDAGKVAVMATKGTIKSRIYPRKIKKKNPALEVPQVAAPLLVPMIEEGYFNNNISQTIINSYLSAKNLQDIQALILGCTHYPLIKSEVEHFFQGDVEVIDSASVVAEFTKKVLKKEGLEADKPEGKDQFIVSDYTSSFEETSKLFFGKSVHLVEERIWD
ncbi:glutamate racemase [Paracrocinitomix mangrovi]|uniref:glutamate racemase n=1 Tax=Paracrocinitomix mangrovi TaxID=2862509 RepID=UPI001C8EC2D7|nr:glutamate racemase [Paracrocinitomix mangrovi]UKN03582.1 glutamate racemase [Paracrocinitomix mangrovi]